MGYIILGPGGGEEKEVREVEEGGVGAKEGRCVYDNPAKGGYVYEEIIGRGKSANNIGVVGRCWNIDF